MLVSKAKQAWGWQGTPESNEGHSGGRSQWMERLLEKVAGLWAKEKETRLRLGMQRHLQVEVSSCWLNECQSGFS